MQPNEADARMTQYFRLHASHPQQRLLRQAAELLRDGGLIAYPTDTTYALGCRIGDQAALQRMRALRQLSGKHFFTLCCRDLSEISKYARVDNRNYRILKRYTPGPFTFVLPATREAPRRLVHPKRRTIGLRVPNNPIALGLVEALGQPMMTTTLRLPDAEAPLMEAGRIRQALGHSLSLVVDGGSGGAELTTVVDLNANPPVVVRQGAGQLDWGGNPPVATL